MATKVTISYSGKTYTLEYTRRTAATLQKQGFVLDSIGDKPAIMIPLLFHGAFLANHPNVKGETKEKIFDGLRNRSGLVQTLMEMYADANNTLFDSEEDGDEGNPGWGVME